MSMDTYGIIGFTSDNVGIDRRIYTGSAINGETDPILAVSYNGGRVDVYLNGIKLVGDHSEMPSGTRDYTFTQTGQGTSIQLRTGVALVSADVVECIGHVGLGSNVVTSYNPTPANTDGGWNVFASINHTTSDLVNVFLNGVLLDDSDYTLDSANNKVTIGGATLTASDVVVIQVIGALDNNNFVSAGGGTFTGDVTVPNLTLSSNVIKASDGGSTITLDTSDNVTIGGDLKVTNLKHASSGSNNIVLASDGTNNLGSVSALDFSSAQYVKNNQIFTFVSAQFGNESTIGNASDQFVAPVDCKIKATARGKVVNVVGGGPYNQIELKLGVVGSVVNYATNYGDGNNNTFQTVTSGWQTFSSGDLLNCWAQFAYGSSYGKYTTLLIEMYPNA